MKTLFAIAAICIALPAQAAIVRARISLMPPITTPSTNTYFEVADMNATPQTRKLSIGDLKSSINATNVDGSGAANTLAKWTDTNTLASLPNGPEGYVLGISNGAPVWLAVGGSAGTTNYFDFTTISNVFFLSGKGNTLIVTQYVRLPWSTLTLTGTNANAPDISAASVFKLTLTTNAFIPAPTGLPGTNQAQTIQIAVKQDSSAIRTLTWNSAYKWPGGSAPTMTTNASAVDVFSFVSSPFDATVLYAVPVQNF